MRYAALERALTLYRKRTLLTALMIGVMRDWLDIPENEKRILSAVKRQRKFSDISTLTVKNQRNKTVF